MVRRIRFIYWKAVFWVLEKFWTFLVEYRNVLESSGGLHGGAHMPQRVHMDQRVFLWAKAKETWEAS
jgi:hypothetical protein